MQTASSPDKASATFRPRYSPATVALCHLVLLLLNPLLLPPLFFSLLFLAFSSFLLFLPLACVLISTFLLWAVLRPSLAAGGGRLLPGVPSLVSGRAPSWASPARPARGAQAEGIQECIELDRSEVPSVDESEEEERVVEGGEAAVAMHEGEEISMDLSFWQIHLARPGDRARGRNRFYELLSFWKKKEKGRV